MAQRWLFDLLLKTGPVADRATFRTDSNVPKTTPQIRKGFDDVCTA